MLHHILIVDDAPAVLSLLTEALEGEGYGVTGCPDISSARHFLRVHQPAAIILDYLFGTDPAGHDLLLELKANPLTWLIPIVICTAALRPVAAHAAYWRDHAIPVVEKPFNLDDLLTIMDQIVIGPAA